SVEYSTSSLSERLLSKHLLLLARVICLLLGVASCNAAEQEGELNLYREGARLIPISLEGYSGEVLSVLRFDLEIQGFELTSADKAQYLLSGNNSSSVVGRLTDRINKASLLAKEYTGGTPRSEAHSLSDEIVDKITGRKGIARTKIAFKAENGPNSEICVADYDGYNAIPVTQDHTITRDPTWVPGRITRDG